MKLESHLRARRETGRKLLVPYVTGGVPLSDGGSWLDVVRAVIGAGADAVEVGLPFSDPVMDGPVIQEASRRSLAAGTTPTGLLRELAQCEFDVPIAVMTYYNIVHSAGHERFAGELARSGAQAAIVPDLPLDEAGPWIDAARKEVIETVMLAAPTTPDGRLERICASSTGFVYGVGLMGVTGTRDSLAHSALEMGRRLKKVTDLPVLIGVGISDAAQARQACEVADGVVVGSALMRLLVDGGARAGVEALVEEMRRVLDGS